MFFFIFILFKNSSCNFKEDVLRLVFAFVAFAAFVGPVDTSGSAATSGSVATSGIGSHVGILHKCFIGNNLLLKLLRTFSTALYNNPKLF